MYYRPTYFKANELSKGCLFSTGKYGNSSGS